MLSDPVQIFLFIVVVALFIVLLFLATKNVSLFPILIVNIGVFLGLYFTGAYMLSTAIIPFFLLILDFALGALFILITTAKKSVRVMQVDFVYLLNFLLYSFILSWVVLIYFVL